MTDRMNVFYIIRADSPGERRALRIPQRIIPQLCGHDVYKDPVREVHVYVQVNLGNRRARWFKVPPNSSLSNIERTLGELWEHLEQIGVCIEDVALPVYNGGGSMVMEFLDRCCSSDELATSKNLLVLAGHGASTNSLRVLKFAELFLAFARPLTDEARPPNHDGSVSLQLAGNELAEGFKRFVHEQLSSESVVFTRSIADSAFNRVQFELVWTIACGMATLEAVYDMAVVAKNYVASPLDIPVQGDHRRWIQALSGPGLDGNELSRLAAECFYWERGVPTKPTVSFTLSDPEFSGVRAMFDIVIRDIKGWIAEDREAALAVLKEAATCFRSGTKDGVRHDVYAFFLEIAARTNKSEIAQSCVNFGNVLKGATEIFGQQKFECTNADRTPCNGLTFYLPFTLSEIPAALPASHIQGDVPDLMETLFGEWRSLLITATEWPAILDEMHRSFTSGDLDAKTAVSAL